MTLKQTNLYFGLALFLIFLATGYYMKTSFKPEHLDELVMRMQIRANHIYILFVALLNVLAFKCDLRATSRRSVVIDTGFRLLLLGAGALSLVAFLTEHSGNLNLRTWTLFTVILALAAIGLLLLNEAFEWVFVKKKNTSE